MKVMWIQLHNLQRKVWAIQESSLIWIVRFPKFIPTRWTKFVIEGKARVFCGRRSMCNCWNARNQPIRYNTITRGQSTPPTSQITWKVAQTASLFWFHFILWPGLNLPMGIEEQKSKWWQWWRRFSLKKWYRIIFYWDRSGLSQSLCRSQMNSRCCCFSCSHHNEQNYRCRDQSWRPIDRTCSRLLSHHLLSIEMLRCFRLS
jgi:hypothetical protein